MTSLIQAPLSPGTKLRLGLLTYCHLIEVKEIYSILENMLLVVEGKRASVGPLSDLYRNAPRQYRRIPPSAPKVVGFLRDHAERVGHDRLSEAMDEMFNDDIRNSFFHSDYVLYDDEYRSQHAEFESDGVIQSSMGFPDLLEIMNKGYAFYQAFMGTYWEHRMSYTENREVTGRVGPGGKVIPVTLNADSDKGLYGFTC